MLAHLQLAHACLLLFSMCRFNYKYSEALDRKKKKKHKLFKEIH